MTRGKGFRAPTRSLFIISHGQPRYETKLWMSDMF
jgi:hypothetical protein